MEGHQFRLSAFHPDRDSRLIKDGTGFSTRLSNLLGLTGRLEAGP